MLVLGVSLAGPGTSGGGAPSYLLSQQLTVLTKSGSQQTLLRTECFLWKCIKHCLIWLETIFWHTSLQKLEIHLGI